MCMVGSTNNKNQLRITSLMLKAYMTTTLDKNTATEAKFYKEIRKKNIKTKM